LVNTAAIPGIAINGANPALQPSTGRSWSLGLDFLPASFSDFAAHATYWHNDFRGAVTAPQPSLALNSTGYASLLTLYPTGATPQQVAAFVGNRPASSVLPNPIYFTYDFRNQNALNLTVEGIDADIHYLPKFRWGSISAGVAGTYKTRFDQQVGSGSPVFSVLNTVGFNSTFPSERLDLRGDLGLHVSKFHAIAYINYTGSYWNWSSPINPIILSSSNIPVGGGDHISSNTTVDTHFSYDFGLGRAGLQVFLDATNVFNRYPPFLNRYGFLGYGYDPLLASPIGRVVTLGVRMNL
jgi:iron complex outermembrane receptor protein